MRRLWKDARWQDIVEWAAIGAVILLIAIGTIRLLGTNSGAAFEHVSSTVGP